MPVYRDKKAGCYVFEFDRCIEGRRIRTRKRLPKTWNHAQADSFDRKESARLYAISTGIQRPEFTIEDAVEKYITERCRELKSGLNAAQELAKMFWAYQGRPIEHLADVCKAYALKEHDRLAPATIKNRIRYLTSACRYGWKHHNMCAHDPAGAVIVPVVSNERQIYISRGQMVALARACTHLPSRAAIKIAFYSGMRMGEILKAKRVGDFFILATTKNGNPRIIPIHPKLRTCLKFKMPTRFIVSYHFRQARAIAGMEWLHFHDLRHACASELINSGVDLYTVGGILGHKSAASTRRYAHLSTSTLVAAVCKIGRKRA
jgi:integrase